MKTMTQLLPLTALLLSGCSLVIDSGQYTGGGDGGVADTGTLDTGAPDTGTLDGSTPDGSTPDAGTDGNTPSCMDLMCLPPQVCQMTPTGPMCVAAPPPPSCDPAACATICVRDTCLGVDTCGPTAEGQLFRGGPLPLCDDGVRPPMSRLTMVDRFDEISLIGPYPVAQGITDTDYLRGSLRVGWDVTATADRPSWHYLWVDQSILHFGVLEPFTDTTTPLPETCVMRKVGPFSEQLCDPTIDTPDVITMDAKMLAGSSYVVIGGGARTALYSTAGDACYDRRFTRPIVVDSLALFGPATGSESEVRLAYMEASSTSAIHILSTDESLDSPLNPTFATIASAPLLSSGPFLAFLGAGGYYNAYRADWDLTTSATLGTPGAASDFSSGGGNWAFLARTESTGQIAIDLVTACTMTGCATGGSSDGGAWNTSAPPLVAIDAQGDGTALLVYRGFDAGQTALRARFARVPLGETSDMGLVLTSRDVGGTITDIFDLEVVHSPASSMNTDSVFAAVIKVRRPGRPEAIELWSGVVRMCGGR